MHRLTGIAQNVHSAATAAHRIAVRAGFELLMAVLAGELHQCNHRLPPNLSSPPSAKGGDKTQNDHISDVAVFSA